MRKNITLLLLIVMTGLSACQAVRATPAPTVLPPVLAPTVPPVLRSPSPVPTATVSPKPPQPTPTQVDPAVKTVQDYFAALQSGDYQAAAAQFSNFSLMVDEITRADAAGELQNEIAQGMKWSNFQVLESRPFDTQTALVHVRYQLATPDAKTGEVAQSEQDELWPVRLEGTVWRYNRGNLIDFQTLDVPAQTTAGLTIKPRQLTRYSDRIELTLLAQNQTNDPIVLGQVNETLAVFLFGSQQVEAEKTRLIFDRLRSYPETQLEVKGLFKQYPDGIIIRQWKNLKVAPWYTFRFGG